MSNTWRESASKSVEIADIDQLRLIEGVSQLYLNEDFDFVPECDRVLPEERVNIAAGDALDHAGGGVVEPVTFVGEDFDVLHDLAVVALLGPSRELHKVAHDLQMVLRQIPQAA